jgi:imidazolonepropionase-like amidohydrolase
MHRIEAELLIPGHGGPIRDGVVVLDGSRISYAGPSGAAPPTPGAAVTRVTAVMPGMWECHGHFLGTRTFDVITLDADPLADIGVLADPAHVTGVWTGGRQVKGVTSAA